MKPTIEDLASVVTAEARNELTSARDKIEHCLDQLEDSQAWWRPAESMNSIGNLILHLCGNVRQWIVAGIGGAQDVRDRPREFAEFGPIPIRDLRQQLNQTVDEACGVLASVSSAELLRPRRIQGFEVTGVGAIIGSIAHFRGHAQEIVGLTRCQLGQSYQFQWTPTTPEAGAG